MGNFVKDSLEAIKNKRFGKGEIPEDKNTVVRIETNSGINRPRLLKIVSVGDDYFWGIGRKQTEAECFSMSNIASWKFAEYDKSEWKG